MPLRANGTHAVQRADLETLGGLEGGGNLVYSKRLGWHLSVSKKAVAANTEAAAPTGGRPAKRRRPRAPRLHVHLLLGSKDAASRLALHCVFATEPRLLNRLHLITLCLLLMISSFSCWGMHSASVSHEGKEATSTAVSCCLMTSFLVRVDTGASREMRPAYCLNAGALDVTLPDGCWAVGGSKSNVLCMTNELARWNLQLEEAANECRVLTVQMLSGLQQQLAQHRPYICMLLDALTLLDFLSGYVAFMDARLGTSFCRPALCPHVGAANPAPLSIADLLE